MRKELPLPLFGYLFGYLQHSPDLSLQPLVAVGGLLFHPPGNSIDVFVEVLTVQKNAKIGKSNCSSAPPVIITNMYTV